MTKILWTAALLATNLAWCANEPQPEIAQLKRTVTFEFNDTPLTEFS